jgi:dienelactone hydrolase
VSDTDRFSPRPEPLEVWAAAATSGDGVRSVSLEYSSRGDRVPARLLLPEATGRWPLILAGHGASHHRSSAAMDTVCLPWARRGAAVLTIDLPLHGERASAKLSEHLLAGLAGATPTELQRNLWREVLHQAVVDLRRGIDAAAGHPEIDVSRAAYAGFSMGTLIGAPLCAVEPRLRAAALAIGGGGFGPADLDPVHFVGRIAPRPVLFVNALQDERFPRSSSEALYDAAGDPKELQWFDCGHSDLPGAALKAIWTFLARELAL